MLNPYEPTLQPDVVKFSSSQGRLGIAGWLYIYPLLALELLGILATNIEHFVVPILIVGFSFVIPLLILPCRKLPCWAAGLFLALLSCFVPYEAVPSLQLTCADRPAAVLGVISATAISSELNYFRRYLLALGSALVTLLVLALPPMMLLWCILGVFMNYRAVGGENLGNAPGS